MKLNPKNYDKPTPIKWRRFGDALLIISSAFSGYEFYNNEHEWGLFFLILGTVGKILTNFGYEDKNVLPPKS
jgi:hypothetical protein